MTDTSDSSSEDFKFGGNYLISESNILSTPVRNLNSNNNVIINDNGRPSIPVGSFNLNLNDNSRTNGGGLPNPVEGFNLIGNSHSNDNGGPSVLVGNINLNDDDHQTSSGSRCIGGTRWLDPWGFEYDSIDSPCKHHWFETAPANIDAQLLVRDVEIEFPSAATTNRRQWLLTYPFYRLVARGKDTTFNLRLLFGDLWADPERGLLRFWDHAKIEVHLLGSERRQEFLDKWTGTSLAVGSLLTPRENFEPRPLLSIDRERLERIVAECPESNEMLGFGLGDHRPLGDG